MVNLFNPEMIIVGGGMSAAGDRLLNTVRDTVENHALTLSNFSTVCVVPRESIQWILQSSSWASTACCEWLRYSLGAMPVHRLNWRLKCALVLYPSIIAI